MRTSSSSASRGPRRPSLLRRFLVLVAVVALCTCKINRIEVPVDGQSSIPKATLVGGLLGSLAFGGFDKINLSTELANQGVTRDQVDAVALNSMSLTIDAPSGQSFDFIKSLTFYAEASGLPKVEIASLPQVPKGATKIQLTVASGVDLKPYVVAPAMQISADVQGSAPAEDTTVSAHVVLDVDVHIPGC